MIITVVCYTCLICLAIQTIYYLLFTTVFLKQKKTVAQQELPLISVILFVKNSDAYLAENLQHFLAQEYPNFEILLVDNASADTTNEILESIVAQHQNVRIIDVKNNESFWGNKKYTFTLAIKAAKFEHLLFSEINSKPISKHWILEMSKHFSSKNSIVLGYQQYTAENSLSSFLYRFDNLLTTLKSFTFARFNHPFTAFANNHAFTKTEFYKVKGFINHIKIKAGKEDLFLRDASDKNNTTFSIHTNSFINYTPSISFKNWFLEKRNQVLLQKHYSLKNRILLSLFTFSKILFYLLLVVLFFSYPISISIAILGGYWILQYIVIGISAKHFHELRVLFFLPFLEIIWVLTQISIFIFNLISKPRNWK